jgi:peroxiredoxin
MEMEGFQQRLGELTTLGARVMGVSADTWATQGAFADQIGAEFPILSDWPNYRTIAAFGVGVERGPTAMRVTFVFNSDGVLSELFDEQGDMDAHSAFAVDAVKRLPE